jgi:signal transduction histidine kinase
MVHVLFVDDDEANLVVWQAACADDFAVLTAQNAEAALELMRSHEVAVVLADQRMPKTTGVELLETIRREFPSTIRMLITAYSDLHAAIDAINRGEVRRYLRKPCEADELKAELADAVDLYDLSKRVAVLERRLLHTERVYALGLIAAGLAHELRNPMSWVKDNVQLARQDLTELSRKLMEPTADLRALRGSFTELDDELNDALVGIARVMDIVQGLELPTRETNDESVEITEVLRMVLRIVRGELRRTAQIEIDTRPVPRVSGTSTKLGQVVLNLLVNSLQALSHRPIEANLVTVRLYAAADEVCLEVLDNGPGIPPSDLPRIFDPFFTTKSAEGTGLGLAISRRIVEELGGAMDVENRPEGGALFRLRLPVAAG